MPEYKSEVRHSMILDLESKVSKDNYSKYLKKVTLRKVRAFTDREVSFDFPVTALVGPNGGGKTTVLGAAALAYREVPPARFFAKSGKYDESMQSWAIEYEIIDKSLNQRIPVSRTANFKRLKWNRNAVERDVLIFGVDRTLPATERPNLKKAIGGSFTAVNENKLLPTVIEHVGKILGKSIEGFFQLEVDKLGKITMFTGQTGTGESYSEFHFGAGEASVIRIVTEIEAASNDAIIIIEEIENGLHPLATQRMVEYLVGVAKRKSCQILFTTHSNDALAPLPSKAIWASYNGEVIQGKLDVRAMRTITGQVDANLAVFVEDRFSELMMTAALRSHGGVELEAIKIHSMGGAQPAISVHKQHRVNPSIEFPSICFLDGDQTRYEDPDSEIFLLPGDGAPEAHVFDCVLQCLTEVAAKLTLALQLPIGQQSRVIEVVRARSLTNWDPHLIWEQIGEDLGFLSGETVAGAFLVMWTQEYPQEVRSIVEKIDECLSMRTLD